jgi:hypothetical protein
MIVNIAVRWRPVAHISLVKIPCEEKKKKKSRSITAGLRTCAELRNDKRRG